MMSGNSSSGNGSSSGSGSGSGSGINSGNGIYNIIRPRNTLVKIGFLNYSQFCNEYHVELNEIYGFLKNYKNIFFDRLNFTYLVFCKSVFTIFYLNQDLEFNIAPPLNDKYLVDCIELYEEAFFEFKKLIENYILPFNLNNKFDKFVYLARKYSSHERDYIRIINENDDDDSDELNEDTDDYENYNIQGQKQKGYLEYY